MPDRHEYRGSKIENSSQLPFAETHALSMTKFIQDRLRKNLPHTRTVKYEVSNSVVKGKPKQHADVAVKFNINVLRTSNYSEVINSFLMTLENAKHFFPPNEIEILQDEISQIILASESHRYEAKYTFKD